MAGLQKISPQIATSGVRLFVIGLGAAHFIAGLRETTGYQGPILLDPDRQAYQAASLKKAPFGFFDPRTIQSTWTALQAGFTHGLPQGNTAQLGGLFLITPDDRIPLSHVEQFAGDILPDKRLLAALK